MVWKSGRLRKAVGYGRVVAQVVRGGSIVWELTTQVMTKGTRFFWYSSARIRSIFKMDTRMDGSVLAVLAPPHRFECRQDYYRVQYCEACSKVKGS